MGGQILLLTPCYHPLDASGPCGVIKQGGQNMVLTVLEQKQGKKYTALVRISFCATSFLLLVIHLHT